MTSPLNVIPFINRRSYSYVNPRIKDEELIAGSIKGAEVDARRGYFFGTIATIRGEGGEDVELIGRADDLTFTTTPFQLLQLGSDETVGLLPAIKRYDDENNVFTMRQSFPNAIPFNNIVDLRTRSPATGGPYTVDIQIFALSVHLLLSLRLS